MKFLPAILVVLLLLPSGSYAEKNPVPESLGRELIAIWQNGNIEELAAIMSADAIYEAAQQNHAYEGREQVEGYVGHVRQFAKDLKIDIVSVTSTNSTATIEWTMTGIQDRPIPRRITVPTNKPFEVRGVTIIEVKDGLIVKATDYMDVLGFVIQLGARVELPGGVVLEME